MKRCFSSEAEASPPQQASPWVKLLVKDSGKKVTQEEVDDFTALVARHLLDGNKVKLALPSNALKSLALRALCGGASSADFRLRFNTTSEGRTMELQANPGKPWKEISSDLNDATFVANTTEASKLSQRLSVELQKKNHVILHTWADADTAQATILEAILYTGRHKGFTLRCVAQSIRNEAEGTPRLLVHVHKETNPTNSHERAFIAYPPGRNATKDYVTKFRATVKSRLTQGQLIEMEARGQVATVHVVQTLATVRQITAKYRLQWVNAYTKGESKGSPYRAIRFCAGAGPTWDEFNEMDFSQYTLLHSSARIPDLAKAISHHVHKNGGVTFHVPEDDHEGIVNVVKAITTVQGLGGSLEVISSFGQGTRDGVEMRQTRFFVRKAQKLTPMPRKEALKRQSEKSSKESNNNNNNSENENEKHAKKTADEKGDDGGAEEESAVSKPTTTNEAKEVQSTPSTLE
mmetsp:Transcript_57087/g.124906  ORF Transcript_57087/g.124906 Transcript_57087/m.124906 type:complete len:463 (-) Transcript_57087:426-1814(-)